MLSLPVKAETKSVSPVHSLTWALMVQQRLGANEGLSENDPTSPNCSAREASMIRKLFIVVGALQKARALPDGTQELFERIFGERHFYASSQ
jgi:hypothetical protein